VQQVFYNEQLLAEYSWTAAMEPGGAFELAAIDLFGAGSSAPVFYDDTCLVEVAQSANPANFIGDGIVDVPDLPGVAGASGSRGLPSNPATGARQPVELASPGSLEAVACFCGRADAASGAEAGSYPVWSDLRPGAFAGAAGEGGRVWAYQTHS